MTNIALSLADLMTPSPATLKPEDGLDAAMRIFDGFPFRHLPVVENKEVLGVLSDRDVQLATGWLSTSERMRDAWGRTLPTPKQISEVMISPVHCANLTQSPQEAAAMMVEHRIGCLPILDEGMLVGIVTETDILGAFMHQMATDNVPREWRQPVSMHMRSSPIALDPNIEIGAALDLCLSNHIRHLPVVEGGKLIGLLSDRDIRLGLARSSISDTQAQSEGRMSIPNIRVFSVMSQFIIPIRPSCTLTDAAGILVKNKISCLPVVAKDKLLGMLTQTDILRHFALQS